MSFPCSIRQLLRLSADRPGKSRPDLSGANRLDRARPEHDERRRTLINDGAEPARPRPPIRPGQPNGDRHRQDQRDCKRMLANKQTRGPRRQIASRSLVIRRHRSSGQIPREILTQLRTTRHTVAQDPPPNSEQ